MLQGFRPREPRTKVLVPCRMNLGGSWGDACIHNVSSRGMLVAADAPPKTGSYVELRRGTLVLVGRVMWREDRFFGVRTQDRVSVAALLDEPRRKSAPEASASTGERRSDQRLANENRQAQIVERNRRRAALFQFVVLAAAGAAAAAFIGSQVYGVLGHLGDRIAAGLNGNAS